MTDFIGFSREILEYALAPKIALPYPPLPQPRDFDPVRGIITEGSYNLSHLNS